MNHKEPAQMNSTPSPLWTFVSSVVNAFSEIDENADLLREPSCPLWLMPFLRLMRMRIYFVNLRALCG